MLERRPKPELPWQFSVFIIACLIAVVGGTYLASLSGQEPTM